eukprot:7381455-Lingulodinium_polyedra.AAC.1
MDKLGLEDPMGFVYDENITLRQTDLLCTKSSKQERDIGGIRNLELGRPWSPFEPTQNLSKL